MNFAVKTAIACTVLHNFCISSSDHWENSDENDDNDGKNDDTNVSQDGDNLMSGFKRIYILCKRFTEQWQASLVSVFVVTFLKELICCGLPKIYFILVEHKSNNFSQCQSEHILIV